MAVTINGTTGVTTNNSVYTDASGNTGIGTSSPSQKLEVAGNVLLSNNQYLGVKDTTGAAVGFPILTGSNDAIFGYLASGTTGISTYQFRSGNNVERMRIDSSGNVGIGTSSPTYPLTLGNNKRFGALNTGGSGVNFAILDGSNNVYLGDYSTNSSNTYLSGSSNVIFGTGNSNTERMRIDSSGNVLVGTTSNTNSSKVVSSGVIESTTGGFRFPDGTTQTTAATAGSVSSVNGKTGTVQSVVIAGTAVASTSGTSIDFTSIPSWVKRITVIFNEVSLSATASYNIQLGTGGTPTYTNTGYVAYSNVFANAGGSQSNSTTGICLFSNSASQKATVLLSFVNITGNTWVSSHSGKWSTGYAMSGGGVIALAAALTAIRITTSSGTDTFNAGQINILYE